MRKFLTYAGLTLVVLVVVGALVFLITAWWAFALMVLVGIFHSQFGWLSTIDFWSAFGIVLFGGIVLSFVSKAVRRTDYTEVSSKFKDLYR